MNNDMLGLLNLAYEIEGLLLLNINRGDEAAPEMKSLLTAKAAQLYAGLSALTPMVTTAVPPVSAPAAAPVTPAPETVQAAEAAPAAPATKVNVATPEPNFAAEVEAIESAARETAAEIAEPTAAADADDEAIAESVMEEERGDADVTPTVNDTLGADSQPTLDEKLARQRAADISKAFTLNDRFRFRRELFRNSDEEFKDTLEVIGSMSSMEEAEDYFFNDLCWDESAPEVKEFMEIVARHF